MKSLSRVRLLTTPWTAAYQAPPSMGFSRQEYWSGVPLPSPYIILYIIYSYIDGHLGYFHILAVVNSATMNIAVHIFFELVLLFSLEKYPKIELLDHIVFIEFFINHFPSFISSIFNLYQIAIIHYFV